jgi:hypothetical protein
MRINIGAAIAEVTGPPIDVPWHQITIDVLVNHPIDPIKRPKFPRIARRDAAVEDRRIRFRPLIQRN